tara:strand:+ start:21631 stop:22764 length:1134 start_codon:yes stop_codon:yes gene_type:complete
MPGFEVIDSKEKEIVNKLFEDGAILFAHGFDALRKNYHVREFEELFSNALKFNHSLAVSSGTAAIKIGLKALGVKEGDEVITQAFNFIATVEAILDLGAIPVIANIDDSLNMDIKDCESLITKKTKVILPVHMLGMTANMEGIMHLASKHDLKVLEDCCEATGAKYQENYVGNIADVGAFSFDFGKVITTGEGGMVTTKESDIDRFSREYHDHGHENNTNFPRGRDTKTIYGFNYRMTEMQAAVGKVQLSKLDMILDKNKERYMALEENLDKHFIRRKINENSEPIFDTFIFQVKDKERRLKIIDLLNQEKFGTKNLPDAIEWHCAYYWDHALNQEQINRTQESKELLHTMIAIPIWLKRTPEDYLKLANKINKNIN